MKLQLICAAGIALIVGGCSLKPQMPNTDINATYEGNKTEISSQWWQEFNDNDLNFLENLAQKNNKDILLAINNVQIAAANLGIAESNLAPSINLQASANRAKYNTKRFGLGANLSYELDLFGRVRNSVNAKDSQFKASKFDYESAKISIAAAVANSYFSLVALKNEQKILDDTIENYKKSLSLIQDKFNAGAVGEADLLSASAQLQNAQVNLEQINLQAKAANTALSALIGKNVQEILTSKNQTALVLPNAKPLRPGINSDFLARRPDISAALERLKAANFNIGVAKANYFPNLSLTGNFGYASSDLNKLFDANAWGIGLNLISPIFDFGKTKQAVKIANLEQNASLIMYQKAVNSAFVEIKTALDKKQDADKILADTTRLLATQQRLYDIAKIQYDEGASEYLRLLEAQRGLLNAQISLIKAKLNSLQSSIEIYKALGSSGE